MNKKKNNLRPLKAKLDIYPLSTYEKREFYQIKTQKGNFIKISAEVKILLDLMDGTRTTKEIADIINKRYNVNITPLYIEEILQTRLIPNGLVVSNKAISKSSSSKISIRIPLVRSNNLKWIGNYSSFLFDSKVAVILTIISIIILSLYFYKFGMKVNPPISSKSVSSLSILGLILLSSLIHEYGHISSCVKYKVDPLSAGIALYLFTPVLYVNTSESWILSSSKRAIIDISGIYFQMMFVSLLAFLNFFISSLTIHQSIFSILMLIMINLIPFVRLDGYWFLSDLIGLPNLNLRAKEYLYNLIRFLQQNKYLSQYQRIILPIYSLGKVAFIIYFGVIGFKNIYYILINQLAYDYFLSFIQGVIMLNMELIMENIFQVLSISFFILYLIYIIIYGLRKLFNLYIKTML